MSASGLTLTGEYETECNRGFLAEAVETPYLLVLAVVAPQEAGPNGVCSIFKVERVA